MQRKEAQWKLGHNSLAPDDLMQYSRCVLSIYRPFAFNYLAALEEAKNLLASYVIGFLAPR
jgi:hypothetical protein